MGRIIAEAEIAQGIDALRLRRADARRLSIAETICESVAHAAHDLEMRAIGLFTETGTTARLISKYRPAAPIYAFTAFPQVANRLNLLGGCARSWSGLCAAAMTWCAPPSASSCAATWLQPMM